MRSKSQLASSLLYMGLCYPFHTLGSIKHASDASRGNDVWVVEPALRALEENKRPH